MCIYNIPSFRLYALWIQSANQPNVKCELSHGSKIFGWIRSTNTYKLTINGETTRISVPKKLSKRKAALDSQSATIGKLSISTKEIFANTTDIETINKNFKLATLLSIVSKNDMHEYDDIIKDIFKDFPALDAASFFANKLVSIENDQHKRNLLNNVFCAFQQEDASFLLCSFLSSLKDQSSETIKQIIQEIINANQQSDEQFWTDFKFYNQNNA